MGGARVTTTARAYLGVILVSGLFWAAVWWVTFGPRYHGEVVWNDQGGYINDYVLHRQVLEYGDSWGLKVKPDAIHGICLSSCTIRLGLPRHLVCVGPFARLGFHRGTEERRLKSGRIVRVDSPAATAQLMRQYPQWVRDWINSRGGLKRDLDYMPLDYAWRHVRRC